MIDEWLRLNSIIALCNKTLKAIINYVRHFVKCIWFLNEDEAWVDTGVLDSHSMSHNSGLRVSIKVLSCVNCRDYNFGTRASIVVGIRGHKSISDLSDCNSLSIFIVDNVVINSTIRWSRGH